MTNLPVVRIDDVQIHPRDNDLVLATRGRSVWIMDDVSALQQMTPETLTRDATLFEVRKAVAWTPDVRMRRSVTGAKNFQGENAPAGTTISYWLASAPSGDVKITVTDVSTGQVFRTIDGTKQQGMDRVQWNLCSDPRPAQPGPGAGFGGGPCAGVGAAGGEGGPQQGPPRVGRLATAGAYAVTLSVGGKSYSRPVSVLEDVWMHER